MNTYTDFTGQSTLGEREGPIAKRIERRTAKLPSDLFLWAAGAALLGSLALEVVGMSRGGRRGTLRRALKQSASAPLAGFVGMWVPSLLLLGVYNKIVKVAGSDRTEQW